MTPGPVGHDPVETVFSELETLVVTDPPAAVAMALELSPAMDATGSLDDRLRLRRMLAMAYAHTSHFTEALQTCEEASTLPGAEAAPIELARLRLASMQPLAHLDRIDDAIVAGHSALALLEASDGGAMTARAALNIGAIYAMIGRPDEALPYFDRARNHLGDEQVLLGQIETNRGTALAALDQFEEAEVAFARASALLNTEQSSWAAAIAEGNLADLAARQGAINRSLRHFEASRRHLEADEALGDLGRLNAEEASVLAVSGLKSAAREAFSGAVALLADHGTPSDLASAQIAYGTVLVEAGALDQAAEVQAATQALIDSSEYPELHQDFLALGARLAMARGDHDGAAELIEDGLLGVEGRPVQRLRWSILRAEVALATGDGATAREILADALATAKRSRVTPLVADISQMLSGIARVAEQDDLADAHAREAIDAHESVRTTIQANQLRHMWHQSRLDIYGDFFLSLIGRDDEAAQQEAFGVAERIRSRTLLDAMQVRATDVDVSVPMDAHEQALAKELAGHRRWLNWMYSALARGDEPAAAQLEQLREREHAAASLADRLALLRPQPGFDSPLSLEQTRGYMDHGTVVLSYLAVGDRLTLQAIDGERIAGVAKLASVGEVTELVAALQFQIGRALVSGSAPVSPRRHSRLRRDTDALLERLYEVLVAPVETMMEGNTRLLVVPSGDLHSVPFAALLNDGEYLADRISVATAPSVSVLTGMVNPATGHQFNPGKPLVVAVPDDIAPNLGVEARVLARRFPEADLLFDDEATRDVTLGAMPRADLIHLACHGRFDAMHPAASGLRLADGWLTLDDLRELRLNHPLVVLTGCETGRVRVERGDDLVGLMAAMITAGASSLVTSLWKTHDTASTALMNALYDALEAGDDLATALRRSQQSVRRQFDHPAMWAPFTGMHARIRR